MSFSLPKPTKFAGRNAYYFYLRIPVDLAQNYPTSKKFIKKSLHTENLKEAKACILEVALAVEQEFQELRRRNKQAEAKAQAIQKKPLHPHEKSLSAATPFADVKELELSRLLRLYPYEALKQDEEEAREVHPVPDGTADTSQPQAHSAVVSGRGKARLVCLN